MTLLAPSALFGLLLLALPIVVHLFKPRKMRQTPFSSLRWLRQSQQRLSRRIQWHQWILFLLRAGLITCLVLALARPLFGLRGQRRPTDRFLVLDAGRGMAYQETALPTPLERAQELAAHYVASARPGDRTALIVADAQAKLITAPVADAAPHLAELRTARAGVAETDLANVLPIIRALLPGADQGRDAEIVFVTDNRQQRWRQGEVQAFVAALDPGLHVQVVDVGPASPRNAWIAAARVVPLRDSDDKLLRVEVASAGADQERLVRLAGLPGTAEETRSVTLQPGGTSRVDFRLRAGTALAGQVAEVRLEPGDALASDDSYFVNLDAPWSLRLLLIEPDPPAPDVRGPGLHLRAGVEALTASGNHAIELTSRGAASVSAGDMQRADVVVLAGVPELSGAALEALEARVRGGAGLAVFLGPALKADFYGQKMYRPLQPAEGLLPLPLQFDPAVQVRQADPGMLTQVRWSHPLLAGLHDPTLGDLLQARFPFHASFAAPSTSDGVLAQFDDREPALVEHALGAGRVLLFNMTADDAWGDLPRRSSYVPLLDRLIGYLAAGGVQRRFTAGEPVLLALSGWQTGDDIVVKSPRGETVMPQVTRLRGEAVLRLDALREVGVYRVEAAGRPALAFAVNASRSGSGLAAMNEKALKEWWAPAPLQLLDHEAALEQWQPQSGSAPLWPGLLLLAALLLLAETMYVYRACPRINPAPADSVVHRRGILRPVQESRT